MRRARLGAPFDFGRASSRFGLGGYAVLDRVFANAHATTPELVARGYPTIRLDDATSVAIWADIMPNPAWRRENERR